MAVPDWIPESLVTVIVSLARGMVPKLTKDSKSPIVAVVEGIEYRVLVLLVVAVATTTADRVPVLTVGVVFVAAIKLASHAPLTMAKERIKEMRTFPKVLDSVIICCLLVRHVAIR